MKLRKAVAAALAAMMVFTACGSKKEEATNAPATNAPAATQAPATDNNAATDNTATTDNDATTNTEAPAGIPADAISLKGEPSNNAWDPAPGELGDPVTYPQSEDLGSLNYFVTNKSVDAEDGYSHFIDGLLQTDRFGGLEGAMAEAYTVNDDATVWTFYIRKNVPWVTYDQKEYGEFVTAHDFVTGLEYTITPENASLNSFFITDFVKGAEEYYNALAAGQSADFSTVGVKALDDYTLQYTLVAPTPFFDSVTTYGVYFPVSAKFLQEQGDKFGTQTPDTILYNGTFTLTEWELEFTKTLTKNEKSWQADRIHIPYIKYFYNADNVLAIDLYKNGEISSAAIPANRLEEVQNDPALSSKIYVTKTGASSWYWYFNLRDENENQNFLKAAKNFNFRKAIIHAFDVVPYLKLSNPELEAIDAMNAGSYLPWELCVVDGRDYLTFGELPEWVEKNRNNFDLEAAKTEIAAAKDELGADVTWPVEIRILASGTETSKAQAAVLLQELQAIGQEYIKVTIIEYTSDTYYDIMDRGGYDFAQQGWGADFADPSNYLGTWISGNDVDNGNWAGWGDVYDNFKAQYDKANKTYDVEARYEEFAKAEVIPYEAAYIYPFRYGGGNYAINNAVNPYAHPAGNYGTGPDKYLDVIYKQGGITAAERATQKDALDAEKAANAAN